MANLATAESGGRNRNRIFRPNVRLDPSQVIDLRRPSPRRVGIAPKTEQQVKLTGRRVGRNLTPGTPRKIGPRTGMRRAAPDPLQGVSNAVRAILTGGAVASNMTRSRPSIGGLPIPVPLPARIALTAASYLTGQIGNGRPVIRKRIGPRRTTK